MVRPTTNGQVRRPSEHSGDADLEYAEAVTRDHTGQLTAEVREAINRLLSALDEPQLHDLAPRMRTEPEAAERADDAAEVRAAAPKTWRLTG